MSLVTEPIVLDKTAQQMLAELKRIANNNVAPVTAAQEALNAAQLAQTQVADAGANAERAELAAQQVNEKMAALLAAMESLTDGAAVTAQVAELKVAVDELQLATNGVVAEAANLMAMHGTNDSDKLMLLCGQPPILFGNGTPQEAIVPDNWKQFDPETGEGYNWNGEPSAAGQQYVNTAAASDGRYVAVRKSNDPDSASYYDLKWINS